MITCTKDDLSLEYIFSINDGQYLLQVPFNHAGSMEVSEQFERLVSRMSLHPNGCRWCEANRSNTITFFSLQLALERAVGCQPETRQQVRQIMEASILA